MNEQTLREAELISFLSQLPTESIKKLAKTEAQLQFWLKMRVDTFLEAEYWLSVLTLRKDPTDERVKKGEIKEWERRKIVGQVNLYQRLWELVQITAPYIEDWYESKGRTYPFKNFDDYSSAALMAKILKDLIDGEYSKCLKKYHKQSNPEAIRVAQFIKATKDGSSKPKKGKKSEIRQILKNHEVPNSWFLLVLAISEHKARTDSVVRHRLEDFMTAVERVAEIYETACSRKRSTSKFAKPVSHEWRCGELYIASQHGGTYNQLAELNNLM